MKILGTVLGLLGLALILVGGVTYGILYTSGIPAFLPLLAGLILSAAALVLNYRESKTEGLRRSARFGLHTGISILFFVAILIFLQTILSRHSVSVDTTLNKRFSLASQSTRILEDVRREIVFTCFLKPTAPARLATEISSSSTRDTVPTSGTASSTRTRSRLWRAGTI